MVKYNSETMKERWLNGRLIDYVDLSVFPPKAYTIDEVER